MMIARADDGRNLPSASSSSRGGDVGSPRLCRVWSGDGDSAGLSVLGAGLVGRIGEAIVGKSQGSEESSEQGELHFGCGCTGKECALVLWYICCLKE
jgi:hypothetical protein